jgi:uncharacterized protein
VAIHRHLVSDVEQVLDGWQKMAFVSGPRQVGKTTLAKGMLAGRPGLYFNWDIPAQRKLFARDPNFFETAAYEASHKVPLVILDELHKYARWKNYLKGAYDGYADRFSFLVTGSGRLDVFKKGGDSLLGRYVPLTLFPLSVAELCRPRSSWNEFITSVDSLPPASAEQRSAFEALLRFGGFPEPFVRASDAFHRTWSGGRTERLVHEDIRDATSLRDLSLLEMLANLLPERVGSPLSLNSMREDLGVAFETVRSWVGVLDAFYYTFRISPWSKKIARSLHKETKLYLWDWAELDNPGARFENLVAVHLLKAVRTWTAVGESTLGLSYVRDKQKREVDFLITEKNQPRLLIECKLTDPSLSAHLLAFQEALNVPVAVQLIETPGHARRTTIGGRVQWCVSADRWLATLL